MTEQLREQKWKKKRNRMCSHHVYCRSLVSIDTPKAKESLKNVIVVHFLQKKMSVGM